MAGSKEIKAQIGSVKNTQKNYQSYGNGSGE
jgi:hypothetical protein